MKLQTYTPDTFTIKSAKDYFKKMGLSPESIDTISTKKHFCLGNSTKHILSLRKKQGLICFSTTYDKTAVDFIEKLNTLAHKIASFRIMDTPPVERMANKDKAIITSTGIATI